MQWEVVSLNPHSFRIHSKNLPVHAHNVYTRTSRLHLNIALFNYLHECLTYGCLIVVQYDCVHVYILQTVRSFYIILMTWRMALFEGYFQQSFWSWKTVWLKSLWAKFQPCFGPKIQKFSEKFVSDLLAKSLSKKYTGIFVDQLPMVFENEGEFHPRVLAPDF